MKARILILTLVLLAACQPVEMDYEYQKTLAESTPQTGEGYTLTVQATKAVGTKALELEGNTLNGYWVDGEKVGVYVNGTYCGSLTADATGEMSATATLSGTLSPSSVLAAGKTITLLFPDRTDIDIQQGTRWDYTGQTGAAPAPDGDLSTKYDYMTATLTINSVENGNLNVTAPVSFQSEQSMFRFKFNNGSLMHPKSIIVSTANEKLVRSLSWDNNGTLTSTYGSLTVTPTSTPNDGFYYFSLRNETSASEDSFQFGLVGSDDMLYSGTKTITSKLSYGKFYNPAAAISVTAVTVSSNSTTPINDPNAVL